MWGSFPSFVVVAGVVACVSSAQATCLTRADILNGIEVWNGSHHVRQVIGINDAGQLEIWRQDKEGRVEAAVRDDETDLIYFSMSRRLRQTFAHPLAPIETAWSAGPTLQIIYEGDPSILDRLDELGEWGTRVTRPQEGRDPFEYYYWWEFLGEAEIEIADCTYPVWVIGFVSRWEYEVFPTVIWYSPDLGLELARQGQRMPYVQAFEEFRVR